LWAGWVLGAVDALVLQGSEEGLRHRIEVFSPGGFLELE
jgi:hypothetical protein